MSNPFAVLDEDFGKQKSGASAPKQAAPAAAPAPVAQTQQKKAPRPAASPAPASEGAVDTTDFVQARSEGRGRGGRRGGRGGRGAAAGGRPAKREFERHSGTGRGREVAKGGAGAHNWGKADVEATAEGAVAAEGQQQQQRGPRRQGQRGPRRQQQGAEKTTEEGAAAASPAEEGAVVASPAAEGEVAAEAAPAAAAEKKPEEEEDTGVSYAEYLKQQAEKRKALPTKEARKAGEGVVIDSKVNKFNAQFKKENDEVLRVKTAETAAPAAKAAETAAAPKKDKNVKLDAAEYFTGGISGPAPRDWSEERPRREGGDRPRGPRREGGERPPRREGGDRPRREGADRPRGPRREGGNQGGRRQQTVSAPQIADVNAFPSL